MSYYFRSRDPIEMIMKARSLKSIPLLPRDDGQLDRYPLAHASSPIALRYFVNDTPQQLA